MQWVLIWMITSGNGLATASQVFYSQETCEVAKAQLVEQFDGGAFRRVKAFCAARTVDKNGAITLDK